jgi:hypothetical protein
MICRLLDATVALDYAADGFVWTARIPTRFLVATAVA